MKLDPTYKAERNAALIALWNDGKSAREVGIELGMPRSSVLRVVFEERNAGNAVRTNETFQKAQRRSRTAKSGSRPPSTMGLSKSPPAVKSEARISAPVPKKRKQGKKSLGNPDNKLSMSGSTPDEGMRRRESFINLRSNQCRWCEGDTPPYDFCCAEEVASNASFAYCQTHLERIQNVRTR